MTRDTFNRYVDVEESISKKRTEYQASIAELKAELQRREDEYETSVKDLKDERDNLDKQITSKGYEILRKLKSIFDKRISRWNSWTDAEEEFGLIIDKDEDYDYAPGISSKFDYIDKITNSHVIFAASEDLRDGDYAAGIIGIPIKYFELIDILDNEEYLEDTFERIKQRKIDREERKRLEQIAELEAEIARLKESND